MNRRRSFIRFAVLGGLGLGFDVCLLWLLVTVTALPEAAAVTLAFATTYVVNFFLNRRFAFAADGPVGAQLLRFAPQIGIDYVLTLTAVEALTGLGLTLLAARILAGGSNAAINYTMYRWWTFRTRQAPTGQPTSRGRA
jgi:putative flippase GtrA